MPQFNERNDFSVDNYMTTPDPDDEQHSSEEDEKEAKAQAISAVVRGMTGELAEIFGIMGLVK